MVYPYIKMPVFGFFFVDFDLNILFAPYFLAISPKSDILVKKF